MAFVETLIVSTMPRGLPALSDPMPPTRASVEHTTVLLHFHLALLELLCGLFARDGHPSPSLFSIYAVQYVTTE